MNHSLSLELLVEGYISQIEKQFDRDVIIPTSIIELCLQFYKYDQQIIYHVLQQRRKQSIHRSIDGGRSRKDIFMSTLTTNHQHQQQQQCECWSSKIYPINEESSAEIDDFGTTRNGGVAVQKNIKLPSNLIEKITEKYKNIFNDTLSHISGEFDVIFTSDGNFGSSAVFFDTAQFANNAMEITGIYWKLPSHRVTLSDVTYSKQHGLIAMGSPPSNNPAQLLLNEYINGDEWKWHYWSPPHTQRNGWPSIMTFETDDNKEKLISLGGYKFGSSCQIYDFEQNEWTQCKDMLFSRYRIGKCYDKNEKIIYTVGGSGDSKSAEYYDLSKNTWFALPKTNALHANYPAVWKEDNMLYVASMKKQICDCVDLRENTTQWSRVGTDTFTHKSYDPSRMHYQSADSRYLL